MERENIMQSSKGGEKIVVVSSSDTYDHNNVPMEKYPKGVISGTHILVATNSCLSKHNPHSTGVNSSLALEALPVSQG